MASAGITGAAENCQFVASSERHWHVYDGGSVIRATPRSSAVVVVHPAERGRPPNSRWVCGCSYRTKACIRGYAKGALVDVKLAAGPKALLQSGIEKRADRSGRYANVPAETASNGYAVDVRGCRRYRTSLHHVAQSLADVRVAITANLFVMAAIIFTLS